ncbi:alpha/beta hydrolase [Paractinoplanes deccanensis]|uniref:Alpha/beta hydrolase n=1 Tax=Paractinoplanes deccanensis TaxID=113561 RepID=A0ABQ3YAG4_9ACTN|nr:alpha/beta hydrolase [Actinoplanes deccanensis]GID77012.1 alpha/beta hydrolase [Actinoplanes deccanensis]
MKKTLSIVGAGAVLAAGLTGTAAYAGGHAPQKPTVVLVHGAFADSSGWNAVTQRLLKDGYPVVAAANPLRGVASDAAQVRALLDSIDGPIVLVGHSYGGSVISQAAAGDKDVKALVYVAAFLPAAGESAAELSGKFPGSTLGDTLKQVALPDGHVDLYIDQAKYPQQFAADVPLKEAKLSAVSQRPIDQAALNEDATGAQAWQTIPSYDLISGADKNIPPAAQQWMAKRAHAKVETVKGASHSVFVSHPGTTAAFIEKAARETVRK